MTVLLHSMIQHANHMVLPQDPGIQTCQLIVHQTLLSLNETWNFRERPVRVDVNIYSVHLESLRYNMFAYSSLPMSKTSLVKTRSGLPILSCQCFLGVELSGQLTSNLLNIQVSKSRVQPPMDKNQCVLACSFLSFLKRICSNCLPQ